MKLRSTALALRRLRQTFGVFRNGPQILWEMARGGDELQFRTRSGLTLFAPNVPGARFPIYEVNGDDAYRVDELLSDLGPAPTVVDIGGHIGSFTTAICAASRKARVHVYEASPSTGAWLQRNVTANHLDDRVTVHNKAVSDRHGTFELVDNEHASAHNGLTAPTASGHAVQVPCVPFDEVLAAAGEAIDLLKMDVEGAEFDIVLGSGATPWRSVQRIVMEYHPTPGHQFEELVALLSEAGLELVRREPSDRTPGLGNAWFARAA